MSGKRRCSYCGELDDIDAEGTLCQPCEVLQGAGELLDVLDVADRDAALRRIAAGQPVEVEPTLSLYCVPVPLGPILAGEHTVRIPTPRPDLWQPLVDLVEERLSELAPEDRPHVTIVVKEADR